MQESQEGEGGTASGYYDTAPARCSYCPTVSLLAVDGEERQDPGEGASIGLVAGQLVGWRRVRPADKRPSW